MLDWTHGPDSDFPHWANGRPYKYFNKRFISCNFFNLSSWTQLSRTTSFRVAAKASVCFSYYYLEKMSRKPVGRRQQGQQNQDLMVDSSSDEEVLVFAFLHLGIVQ